VLQEAREVGAPLPEYDQRAPGSKSTVSACCELLRQLRHPPL
jgi:hypothetical protein